MSPHQKRVAPTFIGKVFVCTPNTAAEMQKHVGDSDGKHAKNKIDSRPPPQVCLYSFCSQWFACVLAVSHAWRTQDFSGSIAKEVNFSGSDLRGVRFFKADLKKADFTGANLGTASLEEADLEG